MKIIAEIGSNWKSLDDCLMSIEKAKEAGANIVKFQLFNSNELYGTDSNYNLIGQSPYLHPDWLFTLKRKCQDLEIEFMCTAFSPYGYGLVNQFVDRHKVASAELTDILILKELNNLGKPVIISTAGSDIYSEIRNALLWLRDVPVTIMFCVGDYPARIIDFRKLLQMRSFFGENYTYGYSDHSIDVLNIPSKAKEYGCSIIEKHVNFTSHSDTDDAKHSLNFDEFKLMCLKLRGHQLSINETEEYSNVLMKRFYKRRFVASKDIKSGDKFVIGKNVGIFRAKMVWENPVLTFRPWDINNRVALNDKSQGDVITYADIETD